ncbi:MAG: general secretion pathway protein GspB [Pseudomonadota bacterium]
MSYILDAIRKAEEQRRTDQVPTLEGLATHRRSQKAGIKSGMLWTGLGVITVLAVLLALWWIFWRVPVDSPAPADNQPVSSVSDTISISGGTVEDSPATSESQPIESVRPADDVKGIHFTVVSYSDEASKRFVMTGTEVLREGDSVQGYVIRQISREGVVLGKDGVEYFVRP